MRGPSQQWCGWKTHLKSRRHRRAVATPAISPRISPRETEAPARLDKLARPHDILGREEQRVVGRGRNGFLLLARIVLVVGGWVTRDLKVPLNFEGSSCKHAPLSLRGWGRTPRSGPPGRHFRPSRVEAPWVPPSGKCASALVLRAPRAQGLSLVSTAVLDRLRAGLGKPPRTAGLRGMPLALIEPGRAEIRPTTVPPESPASMPLEVSLARA